MKYFTIAQAAEIIGVTRMTIYNWIHSERIKFITINGKNNAISYAIPSDEITRLAPTHNVVKEAIKRTFNQYGDALEKLADE